VPRAGVAKLLYPPGVRLLAALLPLVSIVSACSQRAAPPSAPAAAAAASLPPADPAVLEARLRSALGGDPIPICAPRIALRATGDARLEQTVTLASANPEELATLRAFFPAMAPGDELRCDGRTRRCDLTLEPHAEFPRQLGYALDASSPPRVTAAWMQIVRGP
jgi:hypothetical protein